MGEVKNPPVEQDADVYLKVLGQFCMGDSIVEIELCSYDLYTVTSNRKHGEYLIEASKS
jgi:hypothetical protein